MKPFRRILLVALLACATGFSLSCRSKQDSAAEETRAAPAASPPAADPVTAASAAGHDPSLPPIDCPLRRAGVNPHDLQPFDDVEKYIAFLERPDRVVWQKPDDVVRSLGLTGAETVADVGAGSGYFTFRLASALPNGKVVATDIAPEMVRHIHHKAMVEGVANVVAVLSDPDDPKVPPEASVVFVCDVMHHVKNASAWVGSMYRETQPGARVVLIEFKEGDLPEGPPASVKIPRRRLVDLFTSAGFAEEAADSSLLPYQYILTFRRPQGPT